MNFFNKQSLISFTDYRIEKLLKSYITCSDGNWIKNKTKINLMKFLVLKYFIHEKGTQTG